MKKSALWRCFSLSLLLVCGATALFSQADFWQQTKGPMGGTVLSIVENSRGDVFISVLTQGVFRSRDDGRTWTAVNNGLDRQYYTILYSHPDGHFILYGGDLVMFRSTDNGDSWTRLENSPGGARCFAANSAGHVFVGTYGQGVWKSEDEGVTWGFVGLENEMVSGIAVNPLTGTLFAACGQFQQSRYPGVFRSTDNGNTWLPVADIELMSHDAGGLAINSLGHIYVGSKATSLRPGIIYRSVDDGVTWNPVAELGYIAWNFCFDPAGNVFAAIYQNGGVWRAGLSGTDWERVLVQNKNVFSLAVTPAGSILAGLWGRGVYRSSLDNYYLWNQSSAGLNYTDITAIGTHSSGAVFAGTYVLMRSNDKGANWSQVFPPSPEDYEADVTSYHINSKGDIFITFGACGLARSSDGGDSWWSYRDSIGYCIEVDGTDTIYLGGGNGSPQGVRYSTDNGATFTEIGLTDYCIRAIAVNSKGYIYAGAWGGFFRSKNKGATWEPMAPFGNAEVTSIAVGPDDVLYASAVRGDNNYNNILRSADDGDTWIVLPGMAEPQTIYVNQEGQVFVGNSGGAWRSIDSGQTWADISSGLDTRFIKCFALDSEGYLYAGTWGGGVYRSAESTSPAKNVTFFLHGSAPSLVLDSTPPAGTSAKYKDSPSINRTSYKEIGTWSATNAHLKLISLDPLHIWLGLKNSDDQGTNFDVKAEIFKNGVVVASGIALNITGVTRNPNLAKEVQISFSSVQPNTVYETSDILAIRISTKVTASGGHSSAVGLRLYYDAVNRSSRFDSIYNPL